MSYQTYKCQDCGEMTVVRHWPATRVDPPDSTHGDGCRKCGGPLEDHAQPDEPPEPIEPPEDWGDDAPGDTW